MDDDRRKEKLDIVWGSVFLTGVAALSWMILISATPVARVSSFVPQMLAASAAVSIVTVPLLLSVPGSSPTLLAGGRILLWGQAACLGSSVVASVAEMN